jgi:hypothetical protein
MESYWAVAVSLGLRTVPGWRSAGLSNKALLSRCVLERGASFLESTEFHWLFRSSSILDTCPLLRVVLASI